MESVVWYRRISFRLFMVTALIVFLPMFLFWNYSLAASRDFLRVEHADRMHTSLYGASLMMQNLMDEVSTFSREVSRDQSLQSAVEEYRTAAAEGTDREAARSRISLILNEYVGADVFAGFSLPVFPRFEERGQHDSRSEGNLRSGRICGRFS